MPERVLVIDFGSQYTQLILRRIREKGVYSEILPPDSSFDRLENVVAIVLSGGPMSVRDQKSPKLQEKILKKDLPILGICYGHQLLAHYFGGTVVRSKKREYGFSIFKREGKHPIFTDLPENFKVWMSHGDEVIDVPPGFVSLGSTENTRVAAMAHIKNPWVSLQFHPEVHHTEFGEKIIENFLFKIARARGDWKLEDFVEKTIKEIQKTTGDSGVALALSGGVDSTVLAFLLTSAIPDHLFLMFVDTGLLKDGERERVVKISKDFSHFKVIDARKRFFEVLRGVTDPEEKRKKIGSLFAEIFIEEIKRAPFRIDFLAQGTLYPDAIESGMGIGPASRIKSHHNVGAFPRDFPLKLLEPFRSLFKDEVRKVGRILGVPKEIVERHPFPGPGFAVRIIGEVTPEKVKILRKADRIIGEEIKRAGLYKKIWQIFPVLLPLFTVGVMGDERTYRMVIALRAVTSVDGMTADWARIPYRVLEKISGRIVGEIEEVNRVVYDITSKPPSTIEWE